MCSKRLIVKLETDRLVVREATGKDLDFIAAVNTNETVKRHLGGVIDSFENTVTHLRERPENLSDFHIITLQEGGTSIGLLGFFFNRHLNESEILIELMPEYCGKGYGPEALSVIRDWWLSAYRVNHMYATAKLENSESISMLKKCGFQKVGEYGDVFEPRQLVFKYERANT
jgi:RimJ/RimL family protein N-acetyltransferase